MNSGNTVNAILIQEQPVRVVTLSFIKVTV